LLYDVRSRGAECYIRLAKEVMGKGSRPRTTQALMEKLSPVSGDKD